MSLSFYVGKLDESKNTTEYLRDAPEVNASNRNAEIILNTLGYYGAMWNDTAVDINEFYSKVFRALNTDKSKNKGIEDVVDRGEGGATLFDMGIDDNYVPLKLQALLNLVKYGKEHGATLIYWA